MEARAAWSLRGLAAMQVLFLGRMGESACRSSPRAGRTDGRRRVVVQLATRGFLAAGRSRKDGAIAADLAVFDSVSSGCVQCREPYREGFAQMRFLPHIRGAALSRCVVPGSPAGLARTCGCRRGLASVGTHAGLCLRGIGPRAADAARIGHHDDQRRCRAAGLAERERDVAAAGAAVGAEAYIASSGAA